MSDRGAEFGSNVASAGAYDAWPKASIGNYKGVMLCNRPNDNVNARKTNMDGAAPFLSRVDPKEALGLNPTKKFNQVDFRKKKYDPQNALNKHKKYLQTLKELKSKEKEEKTIEELEKEEKMRTFKEDAANQRKKIREFKADLQSEENLIDTVLNNKTEKKENTNQSIREDLEGALKKKDTKKKKTKKSKPAWAMTEKQQEEEKEKEVDNLLDFAVDLDYDKYMEDFQVREALSLIKQRVEEIKKDNEWKSKIVNEWNTATDENGNPQQDFADNISEYKPKEDDMVSVAGSEKSVRTTFSKKSMRSTATDRNNEDKPEWDKSVKAGKKNNIESRYAKEVAEQILENNPGLKNIHSNQSIKKILEREAKRLFQDHDGKNEGPKIMTIKEHEKKPGGDASNLPYLHKNPAI